MTQLPESMIRFRAALAGVEPSPRPTAAADRARLLLDALDLLERIRVAVNETPDVELTNPQGPISGQPAAALYKWGENLRWAVETFEALLGEAWGNAVPRPQTFFNGPVVPRVDEMNDALRRAKTPHEGHATHACTMLAMEWIRCASSFSSSPFVGEQYERLSAIESILPESVDHEPTAVLALTTTIAGSNRSIEMPIHASLSAMARAWTGAVQENDAGLEIVVPIAGEGVEVTVRLVCSTPGTRSESGSPARLLKPRWITDERLRNATVAYATDDGVVCARLHATESFIVREDGSIAPHHLWPRPITSELPFGEGGAIAWDQGGTLPSGTLPSYVMYRRTPEDAVTIEELPFRPAMGTWWNGRMYWASLGSDIHPGRGIASWAPGEAVRFDIDDVSVYDVHAEDGWLVLEPRFLGADNKPVRRLLNQGWRWRAADGLVPMALGPEGASSARSRANGWTATAYPESDLVQLKADDGHTVSMTVYYPFRLAWVGRSLLVSSIGCGLMLFEDLAGSIR
jgi:hypothetical protein